MPGPLGFAGANELLHGLFGRLQAAAAARVQTQQVWQALRLAAGETAQQVRGATEALSDLELENIGRDVLSAGGVGVAQVNAYRKIAGQWLAAKTRLHTLDPDTQITAAAIFAPPWAQTVGSSTPDRYRVRVNWEAEDSTGNIFNKWSTYDIDGPLTSVNDLLGLAAKGARSNVESHQVFTAQTLTPSDFDLQQL